jgi:SET domain-containing protein
MTSKQILLNQLTQNTLVTLKPSKVHGIGVFALTTIPKGARNIFSTIDLGWEKLTQQEVDTLPLYSQKMIENYCLYDETHYFVPAQGFGLMDLSLFINHSDVPNIKSINDGEFFEALRDIFEGDELLIDYGTIVDENI